MKMSFRNTRLAVFAVAVCSLFIGSAAAQELFKETFSGSADFSNSWFSGNAAVSGTTFVDNFADNTGWYVTAAGKVSPGWCFRFGNKMGSTGYILTPEISATGANASVTVTFTLGKHPDSTSGILGVEVLDAADASVGTPASVSVTAASIAGTKVGDVPNLSAYTTDADGAALSYSFTGLPQTFKIRFSSTGSDQRLMIDDIVVTQTAADPADPTLAAPAVTCSEPVINGFTLSWEAVENAASYSVQVTTAADTEWAAPVVDTTVDTLSYTAEGLAAETAYLWRVRANAAEDAAFDSGDWTSGEATTAADPDKVFFTVGEIPEFMVTREASFTVTAVTRAGEAVEVALASVTPELTSTPVFAEGVLTWTPAATEIGTYSFSFTAGEYTQEVEVVVADLINHLSLFSEGFSKMDKAWEGTTKIVADGMDALADNAGWEIPDNILYQARSAVRLSAASAAASSYLVSPAISLANGATKGNVTISFNAARTQNNGDVANTIVLTVLEADKETVRFKQPVNLKQITDKNITNIDAFSADNSDAPISFSLVDVPTGFYLKFTAGEGRADGRIALDSIKVTQAVSAELVELAVPANLAATTLNPYDVTFGWDAVEGASSYTVQLAAAADTAFEAPLREATVDTAAATLDALEMNTAYIVRVRAEGDTALYLNSGWSEVLSFTTTIDPTTPLFAVEGSTEFTVGVEGTIVVTAKLGEEAAAVRYVTVEPAVANAPRFDEATGVLAWTPTLADAAAGPFVMTFAAKNASDEEVAETVEVTVVIPAVTAVTPELLDYGHNHLMLSFPALPETVNSVRVWSGSSRYKDTDANTAFAYIDSIEPKGWSFYNADGVEIPFRDAWNTGDEKENYAIRFQATGETIYTEVYPAAVTNLAFKVARNGTGSGDTTSLFEVFGATADASAEWEVLASYTGWDALKTTGQATITNVAIDAAKNYRRFKFSRTLQNGKFDVVMHNVSVKYEGAGAKLVVGTVDAPETIDVLDELVVDSLRSDTQYYVEFTTAYPDNPSATSRSAFTTDEAPATTLFLLY